MIATIKYIPGMDVGSCSPLNTTHLFSFTRKPKTSKYNQNRFFIMRATNATGKKLTVN